jgi:nucleotide-binding universal stress UspA family protein
MYSKILVAIDGSDCSAHGLKEAIGLAHACGAELDIVHVVDSGFEEEGVRAGLVRDGNRLLAQAQASAESGHVLSHAVLVDEVRSLGDVGQQLWQVAESRHADIVVVGTHGRSGIRRVLMGSVAESLLRHCSMPVLLVKGPAAAGGAA